MAEKEKETQKYIERIAWGRDIKLNNQILKNIVSDEKQKILQMSEISILLDTYDDIFSDFDPRPYSQRALSDDFLLEAKKASKEKTSGNIELKLLIPKNKKDAEQENIIRKRLHAHFKKHFNLLQEEAKKTRLKGLFLVLIGVFLMMAATYIYSFKSTKFVFNLLFVLLEPAGWFITWYGLDQIFYTSNLKKQDLDFYSKMSKCQITFLTY